MEPQLNHIPQNELQYTSSVNITQQPIVKVTSEVYQLFMQNWNKQQIELIEEFKIMLLNRRNAALGIVNISKGGLTKLVAYPKLILVSASQSWTNRMITIPARL